MTDKATALLVVQNCIYLDDILPIKIKDILKQIIHIVIERENYKVSFDCLAITTISITVSYHSLSQSFTK